MFTRRLLVAAVTVLVAVGAGVPLATPAFAAAPSNDDATGATVIDASTTFPINEDTTEATTSAEETALNAGCGAPAVEHGVWFVTTPAAAGFFAVDVTQSDYSAGIMALSGTPGNFTVLACSPGTLSGPVDAGQTIYLMVFGDNLLGNGVTSGQLVLNIRPAVAPPTLDVTIDSFGSADKQGVAHIAGTVTCSSDDGQGTVFDVFGELRQRVGRATIVGQFDVGLFTPCDGTTQSWSADVVPFNGQFAGGRTASITGAFGCGTDQCNTSFLETTIQLRRNAK